MYTIHYSVSYTCVLLSTSHLATLFFGGDLTPRQIPAKCSFAKVCLTPIKEVMYWPGYDTGHIITKKLLEYGFSCVKLV